MKESKKITNKKIVDDENKKVNWWNRNYFFAGTIFIIVLCIMLYAIGGSTWQTFIESEKLTFYNGGYTDFPFYLNSLIRGFFNSLAHWTWQHVLLNMLCFLVAGLYLERKTGSLYLIGLISVFAFLSSAATSAGSFSVNWVGFSVVNYALYSYIIIEYIFSFQKIKRNKINTIFGGIVVALIYLAMCFNGGPSAVGFGWYPYDLMYNMGHYSGFAVGLIIGLIVQLSQLKARKEASMFQQA